MHLKFSKVCTLEYFKIRFRLTKKGICMELLPLCTRLHLSKFLTGIITGTFRGIAC